MGEENEEQPVPVGGFLRVLGMGAPPTPEQVLEHRKKARDLALAALPYVAEITKASRELARLYADSPVRLDDLASRLAKVQKHTALIRDDLEGLAEQ